MTLARAALLLALLLALPSVAARAEDPPPAPPAPAPAPTTGGPSESQRKECQALVGGLHDEVARIRGLAWKDPCAADLITRTQMRADFIADLDEEYPPAKRERDQAILRRLGMLTEKEDWLQMNLDFYEVGVGGFYVPKRRHLRIIEGFPGASMRPLIVHELTHALEDQHLGLDARTKPLEEDSDRLFAEKCVEEGSAEYAREVYETANPEIARQFHEMEAKQSEDPKAQQIQLKTPAFLFIPVLLQYSRGLAFVKRTVQGGTYPERIAALYADPPVSQEQILHPRRWFGGARDYPRRIVWAGDLAQAAGEGWSRYHEMPMGELDLALYLDFFLGGMRGRINPVTGAVPPGKRAKRAAAGWDGGLTVWLTKKDLPLARVEAWAFDTPEDAWDAAQVYAEVAEKAAKKDWKGGAWARTPAEGAPPKTAVLDYVNAHGAARLMLDGTNLLHVEGVPADVLERLWPVVRKTAFERDPRDTFDPKSTDPAFAAATVRNEDRGLGVSVPGAGWSGRVVSAPPNAFAQLEHEGHGVTVTLLALEQAVPVDTLLPIVLPQFQRQFPDAKVAEGGKVKVGAADGTRIVLGKGKDGGYAELVIASDEERTWMARAEAPDEAALKAVRTDLEKLLASIVARED